MSFIILFDMRQFKNYTAGPSYSYLCLYLELQTYQSLVIYLNLFEIFIFIEKHTSWSTQTSRAFVQKF